MSLVLILVKFCLIITFFKKKITFLARISLRCFLSVNVFICEEERERKRGLRMRIPLSAFLLQGDFKCIPCRVTILTAPNGVQFKSVSSSPFQSRYCQMRLRDSCKFRTFKLCSQHKMPKYYTAHKHLCSAENDIAQVKKSLWRISHSGNCWRSSGRRCFETWETLLNKVHRFPWFPLPPLHLLCQLLLRDIRWCRKTKLLNWYQICDLQQLRLPFAWVTSYIATFRDGNK